MLCLLCSTVSFHNWGGVVPTLRIPSLWVSWRQSEFSRSTACSGPAYLWFYLLWPKGCFPTKIDKKVFEKSTLWIIPFFFLCWWGSWHFCAKYQLVTLLPFTVHLSCLQYFDLFSLNVKKKVFLAKHSLTLEADLISSSWEGFFLSALMEGSVNFLFLVGTHRLFYNPWLAWKVDDLEKIYFLIFLKLMFCNFRRFIPEKVFTEI